MPHDAYAIQKMKHIKQIYKCFSWFSSRPPWAYLLAYIFIVLLFASLFSFFEEHFFQPYAKHETSFQKDAEALRTTLTESFQSSLRDSANMLDDLNVIAEKTWLRDFRVEEDAFLFTILIEIRDSSGFGVRLWIPCRLTPEFAFDYRFKSLGPEHRLHLTPELMLSPKPQDSGQYSRSKLDPIIRLMLHTIEVNGTTVNQMYSLLSAVNGFPFRVQGAFWRMLYLSVVTITTLGYGDIVPVSVLSRLLVGCESVLGVILLGFFISSVWTRRSDG